MAKCSLRDLLMVVEVTWRRRKGQPVEALAVCNGGPFAAMFVASGFARQLKVPQSWVNFVPYDGRKHVRLRANALEVRKKIAAAKVEGR